MTLSHLLDNTFVGIDVGGAGLDVAWHRGDSAHYANRPDAIATLVERLRTGPELTRIVVEPTGGYEKALVKALRQAQLPLEIIHPTRFNAYRQMVGVKAKSDTSDARLLASYAAGLTRYAVARPVTSSCRKMRSAKNFLNSQAAVISSSI